MNVAGHGRRRRPVAMRVVVAAAVLVGCTDGPEEDATPPAVEESATAPDDDATATGGEASPEGGGPAQDADDGPPALTTPSRAAGAWASTVGLPVVGAVRTSTPLARLGVLPEEEWPATCRQVAVELDEIAAPTVLTALSVTADQETATLLVGDLRAKADLLAVCDTPGPDRTALVEEVAATHEVAVAWLAAIRGGQ